MATQETKLICHIHDKVNALEVDDIRENVCVNGEPLTYHTDAKHYCLFHLPWKDKNVAKFEEIFRARMDVVEKKVAEIEELPKHEQDAGKREISYDFRYVWFPTGIELANYKFWAGANFGAATFSAGANFISATFSAEAKFISATFSAKAYFNSATFSADANFISATFSADATFFSATFSDKANFILATFSADANFISATFSADAYFIFATFSSGAYFSSTKFSKTEPTSFDGANFTKNAIFDRTRFRNEVGFSSAIFGADSNVRFKGTFFAGNANFSYSTSEGYLRFSNLRQGKKNKFDFQEAAFEKASRVSFHTVDLRPHWFVNVDSRKFSFTDIFWINRDWDFWNKNIHSELDSMAETGAVQQKKRIFEVTARQLAVNAEENNRYEEAAKFRYMAMETRRLETAKSFNASRLLMWLYKWTSGYGESWSRAALVLFVIWFVFGLLYWLFGEFYTDAANGFSQSLGYSSLVMLLQKPDPRPASALTFTLYILETIFAPLQAALLALAIRRKFMR